MAFCWRCTKCCKGVDFSLWPVGSYVHFVPFFSWVRVFTKAFCLEFVRYWNHPPKKRRRFVTIFSHCWFFGLIYLVLQASSAARSLWTKTTKHIPADDGCHVWWFGCGCEVLSPSDHNDFNERVLKHRYIASSMCAMTTQTQLRRIQHVCKFRNVIIPTPPHPPHDRRSIQHVCNDKTNTVA